MRFDSHLHPARGHEVSSPKTHTCGTIIMDIRLFPDFNNNKYIPLVPDAPVMTIILNYPVGGIIIRNEENIVTRIIRYPDIVVNLEEDFGG